MTKGAGSFIHGVGLEIDRSNVKELMRPSLITGVSVVKPRLNSDGSMKFYLGSYYDPKLVVCSF